MKNFFKPFLLSSFALISALCIHADYTNTINKNSSYNNRMDRSNRTMPYSGTSRMNQNQNRMDNTYNRASNRSGNYATNTTTPDYMHSTPDSTNKDYNYDTMNR